MPRIAKSIPNDLDSQKLKTVFRSACRQVSATGSSITIRTSGKNAFILRINVRPIRAIRVRTQDAKENWPDFLRAMHAGVVFKIVFRDGEPVYFMATQKGHCAEWVNEFFEPEEEEDEDETPLAERSRRPIRQRCARSDATLDGIRKRMAQDYKLPPPSIRFLRQDGGKADGNWTVYSLRKEWENAE